MTNLSSELIWREFSGVKNSKNNGYYFILYEYNSFFL